MIICFGDSITAGQYCDPPHWPELIGAKAFGMSNETTREGMQRLPGILDAHPNVDTVLIQFGHNDCNRWKTLNGYRRVPLAEFESNLREMVALCQCHGAQPRLILPHETLLGRSYENDRLDYYSAMLVFSPSLRVTEVTVCPWHLLDDLHLNAAGHRLYADTIRKWLS